MSTVTVSRSLLGYFTVHGLPEGDKNFTLAMEAHDYLRKRGFCQATSSQSVRRGQVEDWIPETSQGKTGFVIRAEDQRTSMGLGSFHAHRCTVEACGQAYLSRRAEPGECPDCSGSPWEEVPVKQGKYGWEAA